MIVWGSGGLSALITNDAVCLLGAPLIVRLIQRRGLPAAPLLLALATGANTGSVATLVGNPQNMLCGLLGGLHYLDYALAVAPVAALSLAVNHGILAWAYRGALKRASSDTAGGEGGEGSEGDDLSSHETPPPFTARHALTLAVIGATALAYTLGASMAWTATGGFTLALLLHRRDAAQLWAHIDGPLLLFFAGLFVVVEGLQRGGLIAAFFTHWPLAQVASAPHGALSLAGIFLLGSNIVSNVPFILIVRDQIAALPDPSGGWALLAAASTFAGNLTLLGSAANLIVA
ncbi:hypothetical protein KKF91_03340, partial [Myxococcota bacterium]|nr:hypothetical protein [Myxococcota bacterium]